MSIFVGLYVVLKFSVKVRQSSMYGVWFIKYANKVILVWHNK